MALDPNELHHRLQVHFETVPPSDIVRAAERLTPSPDSEPLGFGRNSVLIDGVNADERYGAKVVPCLSCHHDVEVKLHKYGNGHIADCPRCGKLAYNGE